MPPILMWVLVVVAAAVCGALGYYFGGENRKRTAEAKIGSAEEEAKRIVNDAIKAAEQKRKETIIEAKDEAFKLKADADKEIKDRRAEISRQERRMDQKEEALDKRTAAMERKEEDLKKRGELVEARLDELEQLKLRQTEKLETIAAMTQEDARAVLLKNIDDELTHEKAMKISAYQANMKDECDAIARELVGQAIARCAADATSEATVSVVPLPSDEMKGRIIGREGRNIRALETATGCDLIIDDTPEAITLSSFDQTRREVARMALERLIADGRIHPARIEETVDKCRRELEIQMKREGEKAVMDLGIHSLHPDLVKLIGRLKYRTSYGQNVLSHSLEVAWLAGLMAGELGVNVQLARRAGLLHDIGKALDHEIEGSHVQIGVDICKKYRENPQIIHAIEAHHGDVEPKTVLAFIIMAADAISAARPGARRENMESYIKRLETLEALCNGFEGVESSYAVQAGREVRILVQPDKVGDDQVILLARQVAKKIEDELDYPGQTKAKLGNASIRTLVDNVVSDQLAVYLEEHPVVARTILDKALTANRAREAARKARESIRRKTALGGAAMPDKLRDCNENNPELTEIYIVEGDSAGGSATQGRDSRFQAILPLWGKMLNVEKARADKVYGNDKLQPVITALGAGIGDELDLNRLRYHKIIIMADADVDGAHIRTLLLTFFFRFMRPLIEEGYVYSAVPPLYKLTRGKQQRVAYTDEERDAISAEMRSGNPNVKIDISRFKGLGEMNPHELWETTMDPEKRTLRRITLDDAVAADATFTVLMGEKVEPRKEFIEKNAKYAVNLDY